MMYLHCHLLSMRTGVTPIQSATGTSNGSAGGNRGQFEQLVQNQGSRSYHTGMAAKGRLLN